MGGEEGSKFPFGELGGTIEMISHERAYADKFEGP